MRPICKVSKYFEFKNFRFSMTSRHPLSVRKAEILEFHRISESLNVFYRFKINVEIRTCFTGSIPYIGNIQMAPIKLKKLRRRGLDHLIWSAKEGKATELMKWRETRLSAEMAMEGAGGVGEGEMS